MADVMKACIILYNMVVDNRSNDYESGMLALDLFKDVEEILGRVQ